MNGDSPLHASGTMARLGLAIGAWAGVIDGALAVQSIGPVFDRLATMGLALLLDGLLVGGAIALLLTKLSRIETKVGSSELFIMASARPILVPASLFALVTGAGAAIIGASQPVSSQTPRPNVLLISVDTLRADHLSAYGYALATSPNLARLAHQGVLFEEAYSHSTWTLPSHVSLLTGLDPLAHGVIKRTDRIQPFHDTLAERLAEDGYETAAWVGTEDWGYVGASYGFAAGFTHYRHYPHPKRFRSTRMARWIDAFLLTHVFRGVGNARDQVDTIVGWLGIERTRPFFAFVHFYDVHSKSVELPYEAPPPFRDRFCPGALDGFSFCDMDLCGSDRLLAVGRGLKAPLNENEIEISRCLYDGGIAFIDHELGRLFEALKQLRLYQNTIIVVTSDHGEAFFEHGSPLHATLHDEITHIPLIMRVPGRVSGKRVKGVVRQSDIAPTLLELVNSKRTEGLQGHSLAAELSTWEASANFDAVAFNLDTQGALLRRGSHAFIQHTLPDSPSGKRNLELYDLVDDPGQKRNRARAKPELAARLQSALANLQRHSLDLRERISADGPREKVIVSDSVREKLRALGYIQEQVR